MRYAVFFIATFWSTLGSSSPFSPAGYCEELLRRERMYAGIIEIDSDGTVIREEIGNGERETGNRDYEDGNGRRERPEMGEEISREEIERREKEEYWRRQPQPELQIVPVTETPTRKDKIPPWMPAIDIGKLPPFGKIDENPAKKLPN